MADDVPCIKKVLHDPKSGHDGLHDYSEMQKSTESCIDICSSGQTCPELLPINCEKFQKGLCNCTDKCEKAVSIVMRFGKTSLTDKPVNCPTAQAHADF